MTLRRSFRWIFTECEGENTIHMQTEIVYTTCWKSHGQKLINDVIRLAVKHANHKQQTARDVAHRRKTNLAGNIEEI